MCVILTDWFTDLCLLGSSLSYPEYYFLFTATLVASEITNTRLITRYRARTRESIVDSLEVALDLL